MSLAFDVTCARTQASALLLGCIQGVIVNSITNPIPRPGTGAAPAFLRNVMQVMLVQHCMSSLSALPILSTALALGPMPRSVWPSSPRTWSSLLSVPYRSPAPASLHEWSNSTSKILQRCLLFLHDVEDRLTRLSELRPSSMSRLFFTKKPKLTTMQLR